MLYDPKWEKKSETKADPFSLESLIAWLEKQPSESAYDFDDCNGMCLLDQYADALCIPDTICRYDDLNRAFDAGNYCSFTPRIAVMKPWTFGAALDRARAALADRS